MTLRDDLLKHRIFIQRLAGTEAKRLEKHLDKLVREARSAVANGASNNKLKDVLRRAVKDLETDAIENLKDLAEYEADFSGRVFKKHIRGDINIPDRDKVSKKLLRNNMQINLNSGEGTRRSVDVAHKQFARRKADELAQIIKDGRAQNLANSDIIKNLDERSRGLHKAQARSLAKTSVNHTTTVARSATIAANFKRFNRVQWVSILDSGTTDYCRGQDGNIYPINEGPRPPAHFGCRSDIIPLEKNS